jgi:hypothetical protein
VGDLQLMTQEMIIAGGTRNWQSDLLQIGCRLGAGNTRINAVVQGTVH